MEAEGLLVPRVLWLLLWVQLCWGKCLLPCPTALGPLGTSRVMGIPLEKGFHPTKQ